MGGFYLERNMIAKTLNASERYERMQRAIAMKKSKEYKKDFITFEQYCEGIGITARSVLQAINRQSRKHPQILYFIANEALDAVKIGLTTNIARRLSTLQISSPVELKPVLLCQCSQNLEREVHAQFKAEGWHIRGEWFRWSKVKSVPSYFEMIGVKCYTVEELRTWES